MSKPVYTAEEAKAAQLNEDWGSLSWLADEARVGNIEGLTLGRVVIKRGQSNPSHAHMTCAEALYLLAGRLEHTLGDELIILEAGDTLIIPAGVYHHAVSTGDVDADMIVAYNSGTRDFVKEK